MEEVHNTEKEEISQPSVERSSSISIEDPIQSEEANPSPYIPPPNQAKAWIRGIAMSLDLILPFAILGGINFLVYGSAFPEGSYAESNMVAGLIGYILYYLLGVLALEISSYHTSIGKLILGLKLMEYQGKQLTFLRILARNIIKWVTFPLWPFYTILYMTNMGPLFTKPITTAHDLLTLTTVVKRSI